MSDSSKKLSFTYNAPVTLTFALISFIVLVLGWITKGKTTDAFFSVYRSPISFTWFIRLFGHVLGHSSLSHYASNMTLFLLLGPVLEKKYGGPTLIEAFGIVAVISGLVNIIFFPHAALLGASGLVFMMIVLVSAEDLKSKEIPITMILVIIIYLGSEIVNMVAVRDNVSQLTHIIGGICGAGFGAILNSKR
ncbi:Membrane associated serine protease, rhomboid family [Lachnospiraceae bacterium]|nr:Membrane associated serine protease, rhomboid family [Lachnospiraceae bacterium]